MKAANDKLSLILRAVADPNRRKILRMLNSRPQNHNGSGAHWCASDVEQRIRLAQPTISHHMKVLKEAGLIETRKSGTWVWYQRSEPGVKGIFKGLKAEL